MPNENSLNRLGLLYIVAGALALILISCSISLPTSLLRSADEKGISLTAAADVIVVPDIERPNILFILTDDLDAALRTTDYMPRYNDLLVEQGVSLQRFFTPTSLCCPSRVTFLRGQYTHNHQVFMNTPPAGSFQKFNRSGEEASTIATWLDAAGYRTGLIGKYLNAYPFPKNKTYTPPGWTEWYSPAKGKPYHGFGYTLNENGTLIEYQEDPEDYMTDVLAQKADRFIRASLEDTRPFFLFVSTFAPHEPYTPAPRHAGDFPDIQAPRTASFNEDDVSDKPSGIRYDPQLTEEEIRDIDDVYRLRVQSMQAVDEMIEMLIATLEELGLLENTYIIFTSDNGFHLGQHRMKPGKAHPYEEDILVPFVIRGPGIPAGVSVDDYLTGNIDFAPTIAELAGVIPPDYVDGRSLAPLFGENKPPLDEWRQAMPLEFFGHELDESGVIEPEYLGVRTAEFLFVEYSEGFIEFYDLENDPAQLENIADQTDPELLEALSEWLSDFYACAGENCRMLEDEFISRTWPEE
ncbi:MAG: sulfatase [Chloroflexi bacterium]|nr:sulfatase [Chloroflexota bacterium]